MPYYIRDPKRDHNFDNHSIVESDSIPYRTLIELLYGAPRIPSDLWFGISDFEALGFRTLGFRILVFVSGFREGFWV